MHPRHSLPTSSYLLQLLWLHAGHSGAQDAPQGGPTLSFDSAQLPTVKTLVVESDSFTVNPTNIVIDSTTVVPDATAITVNHAAISVDRSFDVFLNQSTAISGTGLNPPKTLVSNLGGSLNPSIGGSAPWAGNSIGGTALSGPSSTIKPSSPSSPPLGTGSSRPLNPPIDPSSSRLPVGTGSSSPRGNVPSIGGTSPIVRGTGPSEKGAPSSSLGGTAPVNSSPSINSSPSGGLPRSPSVSQSYNGTASATSATGGTLLPGSTGKLISASATLATTPSTATNEGSSTSFNSDVPTTTAPVAIPLTSITLSGSAASSQESHFGGILIGFVNGGRSWASDITLPAVKTQAVQEIKTLLDNTENVIKNLGGGFPPSTDTCSGAGKRKRYFDPLGTIANLANDALGLANCIDNIIKDISSEIGPLTGPPPAAGIIPTLNAQLDALEKAGKEEEDHQSSTSDTTSSTASNTDSSSSSSAGSLSSSSTSGPSTRSSSSSSASSACATYSTPADDITQWEGIPDDSIGAQKRSAAGDTPDGRHNLAIRDSSPPLTAVNSCNFPPNMQALQPIYIGLKGFTNLGRLPNGNAGAAGQVFANAAKWYVGDHTCGVSPGFKWYRSSSQAWNGIPTGSTQSIDHVYEKQLTKLFLESKIDNADFTCTDMNTLFFPCGQNKMQKIFDQLPGMQLSGQANGPVKNINPGFAGLEQAINAVKGYMFDKGIDPPSYYFNKARLQTTQQKINTIQDFIMLFGVIKDPDFQKMYDVTNNRMYQAFSGIDYLIANNTLKKADGTPMSATWADSYKTWMTKYLVDIAAPAWTWASTTRDDLETQLNADTSTDPATKAAQINLLTEIKNAPGFSQSAFVCDFGLTWQTGRLNIRNLVGLAKRDGSCSLHPQSQSSSAAASTSIPSSTPTSVLSPSMTTIATSYLPNTSSASPTYSLAPSKSIGTSTCIGNQIEGNCIGGSFPSETPYSGIQPPVCLKIDSAQSDFLRVNSDKAKQAAADYCSKLSQDNVVLDAQASPPEPYSVPGAAENGGRLALSVLFDVSGCPTDRSQTTLDFTEMTATECQSNFYLDISEVCAQDSSWTGYNADYTLEGGSLLNDCGMFSLMGLPAS